MSYNITIVGDQVRAGSEEGQIVTMPLREVLDRLRPRALDTGGAAMPTGVRYVRSRGPVTVLVHETAPRVWHVRWTDGKSRTRGVGTSYRDARIALPYLVIVVVFVREGDGLLHVGKNHECFFRNAAPLAAIAQDQVHVPALLNASVFGPTEGKSKIGVDGRPVVWICSQHMDVDEAEVPEGGNRLLAGVDLVLRTLMATGFNYSSEAHEFSSGFSESRRVDPRIATIEAWERATEEDPDFVLQVPWIDTGYTVDEVVERIFSTHNAGPADGCSAADVARVIINNPKPPPKEA